MAVQSTLTPRGYNPGNVAQAQDAAVFERSGAGVYLTMEWITAYIQTTLGNGSAISFGTTNPANTVGEQDDVFFNIGTGEVLSKGASTWAVQANFALDTEVTAAITAAITAHAGATDPHPIYLTQAEATALYKPLTTDDSVATGLRFSLKTVTTGTPANGEIQFNNATLSSVTQLLISETGRDGSAIANLLDLLQQTTRIIIQSEQSEGLYAWFNITGAPTDSGTYRTVPVSFVTAPTGVTTVTGLGAAAAELTLDFYGVGGGSGVGSGLKFTYNTTAALPAQSKQFRANAATPETATSLSFSVTEDQSNSPSVASVLSRLKQNSIIEVRQSSTCFYRYTCSADATLDTSVTPNAYNVNVTASSNGSDAIVAGTVFLSIVSAPTSSGSLTVREVDGSPSIAATVLEIPNTFLSDQGGGVARLFFPGGGGASRTLLLSSFTVFARSATGNDTNDGLTAGTAFATLQKAIDYIASLDIGLINPTVDIQGTFALSALKNIIGSGVVNIIGTGASPANAIINGLAFDSGHGTYTLDNLRIQNSTGVGLKVATGDVLIKNIDYGTCSNVHNEVTLNGVLRSNGNYSISGSAAAHLAAYDLGKISLNVGSPATIALTGTLNFSAGFAIAQRQGAILAVNQNYTGSATGARYTISQGGSCIVVGGAGSGSTSYFPGNAAGTVDPATYGIYG